MGLESNAVIAMTRSTIFRIVLFLAMSIAMRPAVSAAQTTSGLPSPLSLADVIRVAGERRDEIHAARARVRAGELRPIIVSALEDPTRL
jgi:hypothetical protein